MAFIGPRVENGVVGSKPVHERGCACLRSADEKEVWGLIVPVQPDSSYVSRRVAGLERRAGSEYAKAQFTDHGSVRRLVARWMMMGRSPRVRTS